MTETGTREGKRQEEIEGCSGRVIERVKESDREGERETNLSTQM